ncbi:phage tail protein [Ancylobacter sp.]|uniref:phage tail protein n=1 Tax=Ancylobacter sp. TaxID=1872567 RepID=UPI003D0DA272
MSDGFLGELRLFAFGAIPGGWRLADGAILPIRPFSALFSLLGTRFGGDGITNFALPDLRGRVPLCWGDDRQGRLYEVGDMGGAEAVALTAQELPAHTHSFHACTKVGATGNASNGHVAAANTDDLAAHNPRYLFKPASSAGALISLNSRTIGESGATPVAAHNNMQPFAVINFCICMTGLFPPRP